ncbi:retrovirus-related pol polyprotein from transposon TNT 1-94, partial [Tanacetum coccineum]
MVPRIVLTRSGLISLNTARRVNTVQPRTTMNNAGPMKNVINNAYSTARRPFNKITTANNSNFNKRVNTVNDKNVNAARPNAGVNTARPKAVLSAVKGNKRNAIKASAYYEEIDGGFVVFGGNSKRGKITGKDFKLTNKIMVLLKVPRNDNMYSVDLKNVVPQGDHLGKFDGKADEGFFIGYSTNSKAFRVFNSKTRIVEENLHVQFSENTSNIAGSGPNWLFDIVVLTKSMNYKPVVAGNQTNGNAGEEEKKDVEELGNEGSNSTKEGERVNQEKDASVNSTNTINTVSPTVNAVSIVDNAVDD